MVWFEDGVNHALEKYNHHGFLRPKTRYLKTEAPIFYQYHHIM